MPDNDNPSPDDHTIAEALAATTEVLKSMAARIEMLEAQVQGTRDTVRSQVNDAARQAIASANQLLGRGTSTTPAIDTQPLALPRTRTRQPSSLTAPPQPTVAEQHTQGDADIRQRIQFALMRETLDTNKLSKAIGEPVDVVLEQISKLEYDREYRPEGRIANLGHRDSPLWVWRVGNEADTQTILKIAKRLITERPTAFRDLVRAIGARESRVSGVMVEIQRHEPVVDMSNGGHAKIYFLPTAGSKVSGHDPGAPKRAGTPGNSVRGPAPIRSAALAPRGTTRAARAPKKV